MTDKEFKEQAETRLRKLLGHAASPISIIRTRATDGSVYVRLFFVNDQSQIQEITSYVSVLLGYNTDKEGAMRVQKGGAGHHGVMMYINQKLNTKLTSTEVLQ